MNIESRVVIVSPYCQNRHQARSQEFMTGGYIFCDKADGRTLGF